MTTIAKKRITLGVSKIEYGEVLIGSGAMQTKLMQTSNTYRDSVTFAPEDGDTNSFFIEENDFPLETITSAGQWVVEWDILTPTTTEMAAFMGGTEDLTGNAPAWKAPTESANIEKAIKITPKKGYILAFPKAQIQAKMTGGYKKGEPVLLHVRAIAETPFNDQNEPQPQVIMTDVTTQGA